MTEQEVKRVVSLWESGATIRFIASLLPYKEYFTRQEIKRLREEGILKPREVLGIRQSAVTIRYRDGDVTLEEVADEYGISVSQVRYLLQLSREPAKDRQRRREKMVERIAEGASLSQIAREFGVSRQAVFQLKQKYLDKEQ